MNLTRLAGNAPLKRQLELETARRGLSHAYILSGPAGSGKRTLAGLLAAALVCDRRGGALPCLSCAGCRKAEGGIHPDIVRVGDDGKDISVAQVRALRADAYTTLFRSGLYILSPVSPEELPYIPLYTSFHTSSVIPVFINIPAHTRITHASIYTVFV